MLNNEINERYKHLIATMRKEVSDLITETKGTPAKYYRILRGEVRPNYDSLFELINAYPQINGDWLLTGRGSMFLSENQTYVDPQSLKRLEQEKEELVKKLAESESEKNRILISFLKEKGVEFPKFKDAAFLPKFSLFRKNNPLRGLFLMQKGLELGRIPRLRSAKG